MQEFQIFLGFPSIFFSETDFFPYSFPFKSSGVLFHKVSRTAQQYNTIPYGNGIFFYVRMKIVNSIFKCIASKIITKKLCSRRRMKLGRIAENVI